MIIGGIEKISLIDYPGKVSAVIFTQGCNFRCPYCHNIKFVEVKEKTSSISTGDIINFLIERRNFLDGVVISGGEPTLQIDLMDFIKDIKSLGFSVKLDTNGSHPHLIKELIILNLVDYIAMDVKGPLNTYSKIVKSPVNSNDIKQSIDIIINSRIQYEFRSTVLPFFHSESSMYDVGTLLNGAQLLYLQNCKLQNRTLDPSFKNKRSFTDEELNHLKGIAVSYIKRVSLR